MEGLMHSGHDPALVSVSVAIAILASYTALDLAGRVTAARGRQRIAWLAGGATAMGIGIWSMPYLGMLAFHLPVVVLYDVPTVLLSLVAAVTASGIALWVVSRDALRLRNALPGGVCMGGAIAAMHYTGMAAMRLPAEMTYDPWLVALSIVIAIAVSFAALWLAFHLRYDVRPGINWRRVGAAIVMGGAIPSMQYTAMAAAHFTPSDAVLELSHAIALPSLGAWGITVATALVLGFVIALSFIDRRFNARDTARATDEHYYRSLFEQNPNAAFSCDPSGRFMTMNPICEATLGYTTAELLDSPFLSHVAAEYRGVATESLKSAGRGVSQSHEIALCRKDGQRVEVSLTHVPIVSGGRVVGVFGVAKDITKRKRAEEALREEVQLRQRTQKELARLASFPELNPSPVIETNLAGAVTYANPAAFATFPDLARAGSTYAALAGVTISHVDERTDGAFVLGEMPVGARHFEQRVSFFPASDRVIVQCTDITERKRAEGALIAHERFLREIIDAIPHFVFAKNYDGVFTLANRAVARVYGTTPERLEGFSDADFNDNPAEVERFRRDDREVMTSGQTKIIHEEPVTNSDTGETRWFHTVKVPLVDANGRAMQILGVATDITEQKHLEEQLRQSQKMDAVGRLAGGIAHDFNNLLTAITGYADLLLLERDPTDPEAVDLKEIKRAAERAAALTGQLLAFSRKQVLAPKVLDVNTVVVGMEKMLGRLIGEDIELRVAHTAGLGSVEADPGQLEQVILNLAVNARDAMPRGGHLTIETTNIELDDTYAKEHWDVPAGRYVLLAVTDTGVGMDAETKAHMFEPFFTTKEPGRGTGLGLATVYGIVRQSGGHIWVYSEPGQGTSFKVYLPRVEAPVEIAVPEPESVRSGGTETILVVEDEDMVRNLTSRVLKQRGYNVLVASSGDEAVALAALHDGTIHLVATDVVMPRMSGRDLVEQLSGTRPEMRALYLSGYTDDAIVRHGVLEPGITFLQKPFAPDMLVQKVQEALSAN